MYLRIDARDDGRVYGVYSGFSWAAADVTFLDPVNAEHTVRHSWFGSAVPMRSDLHHLFPTHTDVNAARGSKPFGDVTFGMRGSIKSSSAEVVAASLDRYAEDDSDEFEPPEAQKGDTARVIFYFYTMYPGRGLSIERIAADGLDGLLAWHEADPPDARERERNSRIEADQRNRNPYVDYPELACRAWQLAC